MGVPEGVAAEGGQCVLEDVAAGVVGLAFVAEEARDGREHE